jgi:HSP20 family protein
MDPIRSIKLRWLHGVLHDVTYKVTRAPFPQFTPAPWQPAINAYRCEKCVRICVDLAGVDRSLIDLTIEGRQMFVRGVREVPEPSDTEGRALQMLAMEIDYGPFEREVQLPAEIDAEEVHAEQRNGLLWIYLPLKKS